TAKRTFRVARLILPALAQETPPQQAAARTLSRRGFSRLSLVGVLGLDLLPVLGQLLARFVRDDVARLLEDLAFLFFDVMRDQLLEECDLGEPLIRVGV